MLEEIFLEYDGEYKEILKKIPVYFNALQKLYASEELTWEAKFKINSCFSYFAIPVDLIPDDNPEGYLDDLFVCVYVLNELISEYSHLIKDETIEISGVSHVLNEVERILGEKIFEILTFTGLTKFKEMSEKLGVRDIVIVLPGLAQNKLKELVDKCETRFETIRLVPDIGNLFTIGVEIENLGDVLSLSVAPKLVRPGNIFIKRLFEFILTLFLVIFFLPIILIIALAIKIDSPGPIIFAHERLGWRNKTFRFFKFRSMYVDGDLKLNKFLKENSLAKEEWKKYRKIKQDDPRITRAGRFIRKYSLDELPQLINIIKGNMSLVGPRPYMPREIEDIGKSYPIITRVKPGITGLWQVRGRNILPFEERLILDEYYIRNWSLWLDMVILIKTIKVFLTREGAY